MSASIAGREGIRPQTGVLFALTAFAGAALIFIVQPLFAKLLLPLLGGAPSVWNASVAFFQAALLAGYAYAHLLQRLPGLRAQASVHGAALLAAAVVLPLKAHQPFGPPSSEHPALWLVGVLVVSIGAPVAVLSATAPLLQAWHARVYGGEGARDPYTLYVASNLGSLIALLAYPLAVEPRFTLSGQALMWSAAYGGFLLLMLATAWTVVPQAGVAAAEGRPRSPVAWPDRMAWTLLAAAPSSLMLGVTAHITADVASAPFLWVVPLALYLLTFIIAFSAKPAIPWALTLPLQAGTAAASAVLIPTSTTPLPAQFAAHLSAFFFTALLCHQALVRRRPPAARLTEFYLWISIGGVLGGAFNAFLAPVIFDNVWEFPLVLTLSALARPLARRIGVSDWVMLGLVTVTALGAMVVTTFRGRFPESVVAGGLNWFQLTEIALLSAAALAAVRVRKDRRLFCAALAILSIGAYAASERAATRQSWRSFFGVLRISETQSKSLGGTVRMLAHGTTLHGAQALSPEFECWPMIYYTPRTPIGQVFQQLQIERPALRIGVVGLGTGSVAAYVRSNDALTFYEIDPLVLRVANDPRHFTYTTKCPLRPVGFVVGDARLTLAKEPPGSFDLLLIDAFSSDAVPAHLLTVEALRSYLAKLKPNGVILLHLSNRHLDLMGPAQSAAYAAGGSVLVQQHRIFGPARAWESDVDAVIVGRSRPALASFAADRRWRAGAAEVRPWRDDYVNAAGALWRKFEQRQRGFY